MGGIPRESDRRHESSGGPNKTEGGRRRSLPFSASLLSWDPSSHLPPLGGDSHHRRPGLPGPGAGAELRPRLPWASGARDIDGIYLYTWTSIYSTYGYRYNF